MPKTRRSKPLDKHPSISGFFAPRASRLDRRARVAHLQTPIAKLSKASKRHMA
jgi:hypothetical protein